MKVYITITTRVIMHFLTQFLLSIIFYIQLLLEADFPEMVDDVLHYMKHLHSRDAVTGASVGQMISTR